MLADLVADEFVFGEIARVSREAPVLILKYRDRTVTPGGGGNAIMNLASLGVKVLPCGVVGDDEPGALLLDEFREKKDSDQRDHATEGPRNARPRRRILAGMSHTSRQQVVRAGSRARPSAGGHPVLAKLVKAARKYGAASDGVPDFRLRVRSGDAAIAPAGNVEWLPREQADHAGFALPACWNIRESRRPLPTNLR